MRCKGYRVFILLKLNCYRFRVYFYDFKVMYYDNYKGIVYRINMKVNDKGRIFFYRKLIK